MKQTKKIKWPLLEYEDTHTLAINRRPRTLQQDQNREFWLDLLRDTIRLIVKVVRYCWRIAKPRLKIAAKWLKIALKRLLSIAIIAEKIEHKNEKRFTIGIKYLPLVLLLVFFLHPHNHAGADIQAPQYPWHSSITYAKKLAPTKLKPQSEITPVNTAPVSPPAPVNGGVVDGCGDNSMAHYIYMHESGCNTGSVNDGGCFGIGQDCNGVLRAQCGTDYDCQNAFFNNYANTHCDYAFGVTCYHGWAGAYAFWLAHNYW